MKLSALIFGITLVTSAFADSRIENYTVLRDAAEINVSHTQIKITDVRYSELPTSVQISKGNCPSQERWEVCEDRVVLERMPVVQVFVEYKDGIFPGSGGSRTEDNKIRTSFRLPLDAFSPADIEDLKSAGFRARKNFIKDNLNLETTVMAKTIMVVDVRNSKLCSIGARESQNCQENLVYKPMTISVKKIKVTAK